MRRSTIQSLPLQLVFPGETESGVVGSERRENSRKEGREEGVRRLIVEREREWERERGSEKEWKRMCGKEREGASWTGRGSWREGLQRERRR
jgi:hypothetical protein